MQIGIEKNVKGDTFKISKVKMLKFEKNSDEFSYKTSYEQSEWDKVNFRLSSKKKRPQRCTQWQVQLEQPKADVQLKKLYSKPIKLTEAKKDDLNELFTKKLIPSSYKSFYESILK